MKKYLFICIVIVYSFVSCKSEPEGNSSKDTSAITIYHNGKIITMETNSPQYMEAVAEENGKIIFVGSFKEAEKKIQSGQKIDLKGSTLLPGFIDPHSHFDKVSHSMGQLNLSPPPVGDVTSIPQVMEKLKAYKKEHNIPDGEWIFAWGYDDNQLEEKRHLNKNEIDAVLPNNPVYLDHTSGHMGVANSLALKMMGVTAESIDPPGGNIDRFPGTNEPNGLVQETAMYPFVGNMIQVLDSKSDVFFELTQNYYAENGITTANDGMVGRKKLDFYKKMADEGKFKIDLITLAGFKELEINLKDSLLQFNTYSNKLKIQGTKIIGDGSPQGKTAFFKKPYLTRVAGCSHLCTGLPSVNQEELERLFILAYKNDNQVFTHCNGDASIDMVLKAHEKACAVLKQPLDKDRRTVVIHSQFVRPDQLEKYVKYKIIPSFFTNHAYFWGDVHTENLGEERANFLSPISTADKMGIMYTNHSDATVTPIYPIFTIWSAVNRTSRSGNVIGEQERATVYQALKAITINAAYQHFDEKVKGSLVEGKLADFVILDQNPLTSNPKELKNIRVLKTIKEGKIVFEKYIFL
ncbi:amidohydrolase [Flavobacterium piscinae]|uniref:amidohydrolase n=1 Tax=Flavobacterium piscinae TaxID=2506424 RepID=UPI0019BD1C8F|nr:amidohydrolase [Flavobacterium piscinae]MBC8882576.1 amidohydrolase [Flavobacterium piscinae]